MAWDAMTGAVARTDRLRGQVVGSQRWSAFRRAVRRPRAFLSGLVRHIAQDGLTTLAAALSYYFFFALFPFVLFLLALITLLPGVEGLQNWLLQWTAQIVPGEAYETLAGVINGLLSEPRGGILSLGAVLALWSASSAFAGLMNALNITYGVRERRPWWKVRLLAIGLTVALSFFMILAFVLAVGSGPLATWLADFLGPIGAIALLVLNWLAVLAAITLVIASVYHFCPDVDFPWRWFSPGSVLFTLGFGTTTMAFSYYVARFASFDKTYGSLGAVIILLLWMYLLALFVLLGGEINAYLDREAEDYTGSARLPPPSVDGPQV